MSTARPVRLSASELRREISSRNLKFAEGTAHETTFGEVPSVLYQEVDGIHGNFLPASYRRICASPEWRKRLEKWYCANCRVPRSADRIRRELDCANSSDALLMNVFCYPGVVSRKTLCALLGVSPGLRPQFGVKAEATLTNGWSDRTEIDMTLGHLYVEAKLTESGFQKGRRDLVHRYRDLETVFRVKELPASGDTYYSYQLIRGILAAHHAERSFLLLFDGRRSDLCDAWYRVVRAVQSCDLRARLALLTWQELSSVLPNTLQNFLENKYGISPAR